MNIEKFVFRYIDEICECYTMDEEDKTHLKNLWFDVSNGLIEASDANETTQDSQKEKKKVSKKKVEQIFSQETQSETQDVEKTEKTKKIKKTEKDSDKESSTCQYVFSKGKNAGEKCPTKIKEGEFCSKHKPKSKDGEKSVEKKEKKEKKEKDESKEQTEEMTQQQESEEAAEPKKKEKKDEKKDEKKTEKKDEKTDEKKTPPKQFIISMNSGIGKYWSKDTRFVFESAQNKLVIGKLDSDDKTINSVENFTEEDLELVKKYNLKMKEPETRPEVPASSSISEPDAYTVPKPKKLLKSPETKSKSVEKKLIKPSKPIQDDDDEEEEQQVKPKRLLSSLKLSSKKKDDEEEEDDDEIEALSSAINKLSMNGVKLPQLDDDIDEEEDD